MLTGGGARAAYQAGLILGIGRRFPDLKLPILTGVSAGAINAVQLAAHEGRFLARAETLEAAWRSLTVEKVFRAEAFRLYGRAVRWLLRLASGGHPAPPPPRGLVDTAPLWEFLGKVLEVRNGDIPGITRNLGLRELRSVAITASSYTTGRSVTWMQSWDECNVHHWERAHRTGEECRLTLAHVMASAALPLVFPAVQVGDEWFGDGGMRLTAPLSPAIHLGAERIIAISTRYAKSLDEAARPSVDGYPPLAQIGGVLLNALFLDLLDGDALGIERINRLIDRLPDGERHGMRRIDLLLLRPSQDLGQMANAYEASLPRGFRFLTRGLGTRETRSNDLLSLVMFQPDYVHALLELGERDAEARAEEIARFLSGAEPG